MKKSLAKMIGKGMLRLHELEEVLLDVEYAMNNRPLCYQGEDFDEPVITPNLLIRGGRSTQLTEDLENMEPQEKATERLFHLHKVKEQLRTRWMVEYIKALEERRRQHSETNPDVPKKGSVVLLKEDIKNKTHWKIGRVVKHIRGRDGVTRGAKIKLGNGYVVDRPLQLICDLEIGGDAEEKQLNPEAAAFEPTRN